MKITKLSWAGLLLESGNTQLYIDPLQNVEGIFPFVGAPKSPIVPVPLPEHGPAEVLITHIHADHYDTALYTDILQSRCIIYGPAPVVQAARATGLKATITRPYDTFYVGEFSITPVPAVDWVGEDQVSYVISDGKQTIFHGGDTNWHGYWWTFAERFGPFDAAFLPVNGVKGFLPGQEITSEISGTMDPQQAVTAARILRSKMLVPIHYGLFDSPPGYSEYPQVESSLDKAASAQSVKVYRMGDGEIMEY
jgi:L-ascorbate metabolism protein UlaG (beta-lactamase superfamily)